MNTRSIKLLQPIKNNNQQGVALLVVLLLVVSITIVAGSMLASQKVTIRKASLLFEQNKMNNNLQAGVHVAVQLITADMELNEFDSLEDVWAKDIPPHVTEDGYSISLEVYDTSSRFNLNNLYHDGQVDEQAFAVFQQLLTSLDLDISLAKTVLDWQDPDGEVYQDGGEEIAVYQMEASDNDQVKQIANQPFMSVDQLSNLPNVTSDTINILRPYITAVPYWLPINMNTANEKVLTAIFSDNTQSVQTVLSQQGSISNQEALEQMKLFDYMADDNSDNQPNKSQEKTQAEDSKIEDGKSENSESENSESENNKKVEQLKKLVTTNSGAFEVLISVSNQDESKHKYATVMIAKDNNGTVTSQSVQTKAAVTDVNDNKDEVVVAYAYRGWAFRPNLAYTQ